MALTINDVSVRELVRDFVFGYSTNPEDFIARQIVPEYQAGLNEEFAKMDIGDALRWIDDSVGPAGIASLLEFDTSYITFDQALYALKGKISKRVRDAAKGPIAPRRRILKQIMHALRIGHERRVAATLYSGTFTSAAATAAFGAGGDDPIGDLITRMAAVADASNRAPNTLIFGAACWRRFIQTTDAKNFVSSYRMNPGAGGTGVVTPQLAAEALNVEGASDFRIYVARARQNAVAKGGANSITNIWTGTNVGVGYFERSLPQNAAPTGDLVAGTPGPMEELGDLTTPIATVFGPQMGEVLEWEDPETQDMFLRVNWDYVLSTPTTEAFQYLTGC